MIGRVPVADDLVRPPNGDWYVSGSQRCKVFEVGSATGLAPPSVLKGSVHFFINVHFEPGGISDVLLIEIVVIAPWYNLADILSALRFQEIAEHDRRHLQMKCVFGADDEMNFSE